MIQLKINRSESIQFKPIQTNSNQSELSKLEFPLTFIHFENNL